MNHVARVHRRSLTDVGTVHVGLVHASIHVGVAWVSPSRGRTMDGRRVGSNSRGPGSRNGGGGHDPMA